MFRRKILTTMASAAALAAFAAPAFAQSDYPNRPIEIVVPFGTGGSYTAITRALSVPLSEAIGQPINIVNKPGSAAIIGTKFVADARPDGYTILFAGTSPLALAPVLRDDVPYDPLEDFEPIVYVGEAPYYLIANPDAADSVQEIIDEAKARPGELNWASAGRGSLTSLSMRQLMLMTGIEMEEIPYPGVGPQIVDLLEGRVEYSFAPLSAVPQVRSGELKPLAVSTAERSETFPDVPTVSEAGVPGFEATAWYAMLAPAGTPKEIVDKLNAAINTALRSETFKKQAAAFELTPAGGTSEFLGEKIKSEIARWGDVVERAGIELEQ